MLTLLDWRGDWTRSATAFRYAAAFFETQGNSFLDGRIDVPPESMGIEGFEIDGRTYMYFGPFPALIRMPLLLVTNEFNGQLTVLSMALAWIVLAVFASRLLWLVRTCLVGERSVTRLDAVLAAVLLAGITGGTNLTFDAALPWVYNEVYLWQAALVVTAMYWMIRVALDPSPATLRWLGLAALAAALTRTTGGWAVCIGVIGLAIWLWRRRAPGESPRIAALCLAAALVPLAIASALNLAKFGNVFLFPLEEQVWTEVNAHRREALEVNGGTITGLQFFRPALVAYFSPLGIRFVDYFPWITLPAEPAGGYGAFIDQSYRTGSVTAFMTVFLVLALAALPVLLRRGSSRPDVAALRLPALSAFLMTGGVMAYGYLAFRYTGEFVPALILGSTISLWAWVAPLAARGRVAAAGTVGVLSVGVAFAMAANALVGFSAAAMQYRGEPVARYLSLQNDLSGGPGSSYAGLIRTGDGLPEEGRADDLWVRGDCDGLYLHTGDAYEPWVIVEERAVAAEVTLPEDPPRALTPIVEFAGVEDREVRLETWEDGEARLVINNETGNYYGQKFRLAPDQTLRIGVRTDSSVGYAEVSSSPGGFVGYVPVAEYDEDWISRIGSVELAPAPDNGITVTPQSSPDLPLCERIVADNDIDLP